MNPPSPLYSPDDAYRCARVMLWCGLGVFVTIVVLGVLRWLF